MSRVLLNKGNLHCIALVLLFPRIELRALGKITEGEELTVSYVDFLNLSADRKKELKKRFHFECTCEHCSHHIKDDLMIAVAESKVREDLPSEDGCTYKNNATKYRYLLFLSFLFFPCCCALLSALG